jgi:hypothetical protein
MEKKDVSKHMPYCGFRMEVMQNILAYFVYFSRRASDPHWTKADYPAQDSLTLIDKCYY